MRLHAHTAEAVGLEPTSRLDPPPVFETGSSSSRMTSGLHCRVGRKALESLSPGLQPGATPSQLPTRRKTKTPEVTGTSGVQTCQNQHLPTSTAQIKHRPTGSIGGDPTECRRIRIDKRARGRTGQGGQVVHGSCGTIGLRGVSMTSTGIKTQTAAGRFTKNLKLTVALLHRSSGYLSLPAEHCFCEAVPRMKLRTNRRFSATLTVFLATPILAGETALRHFPLAGTEVRAHAPPRRAFFHSVPDAAPRFPHLDGHTNPSAQRAEAAAGTQ